MESIGVDSGFLQRGHMRGSKLWWSPGQNPVRGSGDEVPWSCSKMLNYQGRAGT